jgi:hypothetical protein
MSRKKRYRQKFVRMNLYFIIIKVTNSTRKRTYVQMALLLGGQIELKARNCSTCFLKICKHVLKAIKILVACKLVLSIL